MKFPETLNDIKLNSYQKYLERDELTEENLVKDLLEINDNQLSKFKLSEIDTLIKHFEKLFSKEDHEFVPTFEMNGVQYGFIPKLDDITYGENKDLTKYINSFKTMHNAMAVAYRPIEYKQGKKYLIEEYKGSLVHAESMKHAPLDVVFGMMVFFYNLTNELPKVTRNYLEKELEKQANSHQNGEDMEKYTALLREILGDLRIYPN